MSRTQITANTVQDSAGHCLAPQLAATQATSFLLEASEHDVFAYFEQIAASGRTPTLITDKDGTLTTKSGELTEQMAERIALLLSYGCKIIMLSANAMHNIEPQFIEPLKKEIYALNEQRKQKKQDEIDLAVLENLIICPTNGGQVWTYDKQKESYAKVHTLWVEPLYYQKILQTVEAVRGLFLTHPLYLISKNSHIRDTGTQLTLLALAHNVPRNKKNDFHAREDENMEVMGYTKREIWTNVLQEAVAIHEDGKAQEFAALVREYNATILNGPEGQKKKQIQALFDSGQFTYFADTTLARTMLDMLDKLDGQYRNLDNAVKRMGELEHLVHQDRVRLERGGLKHNDVQHINRRIAKHQKLHKYWKRIIEETNALTEKKVPRKHLIAMHQLSNVVTGFGALKGHRYRVPEIEAGGQTSIDLKFISKGESIDRILKLLDIPAWATLYYGDEFFKNGGDTSALESKTGMFVNVGTKVDFQGLDISSTSRICTIENGGPEATQHHLDHFIGIIQGSDGITSAA